MDCNFLISQCLEVESNRPTFNGQRKLDYTLPHVPVIESDFLFCYKPLTGATLLRQLAVSAALLAINTRTVEVPDHVAFGNTRMTG